MTESRQRIAAIANTGRKDGMPKFYKSKIKIEKDIVLREHPTHLKDYMAIFSHDGKRYAALILISGNPKTSAKNECITIEI